MFLLLLLFFDDGRHIAVVGFQHPVQDARRCQPIQAEANSWRQQHNLVVVRAHLQSEGAACCCRINAAFRQLVEDFLDAGADRWMAPDF